jgi:hypothetical protein
MGSKFRNIRVRMKGGKTRIQRAKVLASGKLKFVKNLSRSRSRAAPRQKTTKRRVVSIRRGKKYHRSGKSLVRSVEKILTGVSLVAPAAIKIAQRPNAEGGKDVLRAYTGINMNAGGKWEPHALLEGWGAFVGFTVAKTVTHKLIGLLRRI